MKAVRIVNLAAVLFLFSRVAEAGFPQNRIDLEKSILDNKLAADRYDPSIRPKGPAGNITGPVVVRTNLYIRNIRNIDDANMEYDIQITFRQQWVDKRLEYDVYDDKGQRLKYLTLRNPSKIWIPDTFFSNELNGHFHDIIHRNVLVRIFPSGDILYSIRLSLNLACPMDLTYYPLDTQICSIVLASYGYTTDDVIYLWRENNPVEISKNLIIKKYVLENIHSVYCKARTSTGTYSCARVDLQFRRKFNYYFVHIFMPCIFMVILSWIPLWLDYKNTTARVVIWVTILLTTIIVMAGIRTITIDVSFYTNHLDNWTGTCLTFVFVVAIELVVVNHFVAKEAKEQKEPISAADEDPKKPLVTVNSANEISQSGEVKKKIEVLTKWFDRYPSIGMKIDIISRALFPLAFLLFNLCYWAPFSAGGN